jgi:hypothetical protein
MKDWDEPSTLAVLALLIGIALGTLSGYELALDRFPKSHDLPPTLVERINPDTVIGVPADKHWVAP